MELKQNQLEAIINKMQMGELTADQANVEMVLTQRVKVAFRVPRDTRKALNAAVKSGTLGRMKKEGGKPEVYYNPKFEHLAKEERAKIEREYADSLAAAKKSIFK